MSFLVGCFLIHHFDLGWWWYAISAAIYSMEWNKHFEYYNALRNQIQALENELQALKAPIDHDYD